jgi:hypothetical protein
MAMQLWRHAVLSSVLAVLLMMMGRGGPASDGCARQ